jgi:hypothetical protein
MAKFAITLRVMHLEAVSSVSLSVGIPRNGTLDSLAMLFSLVTSDVAGPPPSRQRQRIGGDFLNLCRRESSDGGDSCPRRRLRSRSMWWS